MQAGDDRFCPVARTAELLTRRWMPLVLLELMGGRHRFNDIRRGVGRISPGLLTQRLRELEEAGLATRRPTDEAGYHEYHLTLAGRELRPVIEAMGVWGRRWMERRISARDHDAGSLMWDIRHRMPLDSLPESRVTIHFRFDDAPRDLQDFWLVLDGGVDLCLRDPGYSVDIAVRSDVATLASVWLGELSYDLALRRGTLGVSGLAAPRRAFPRWLGLRRPVSAGQVAPRQDGSAASDRIDLAPSVRLDAEPIGDPVHERE